MSYSVKLDINDIQTFCKKIQKLDFEVDAKHGRHVIDAKSIMGLYSLDISYPIVIEPASDHITVEQAGALKEAIREYEV